MSHEWDALPAERRAELLRTRRAEARTLLVLGWALSQWCFRAERLVEAREDEELAAARVAFAGELAAAFIEAAAVRSMTPEHEA